MLKLRVHDDCIKIANLGGWQTSLLRSSGPVRRWVFGKLGAQGRVD